MKKRLGIDLGTNSIGWAIREENDNLENQIIDKGVLLFDKGVASDKGNEFPKVQKRTKSRGMRRNYQAEKYRKHALLKFLIEKDMCPLTIEELDSWKKYRKGQRKEYPQSKNFLNWLRFDFDGDGKPDFHLFGKDKHESNYIFRAFCVDETYKNVFDDNPQILGRILYQLCQRRGFKGRDEEEAKTVLEGSTKTGTRGRNDIEDFINKYNTLGAALYFHQKEEGGRIRNRYNLRKDFENELKIICKIHNISDEDYKKLYKYIISQRQLRSQKGLVGLCTFEKNKRRVHISHPWYQEYKTWVFINNLKIIAPENKNQIDYLQETIYPLFIRKSDFEIKAIVKKVNEDGGEIKSHYKSSKLQDTKIVSLSNFYDFKEIFGDDWKEKFKFEDIHNREKEQIKKQGNDYTIEDLWHVLHTFDDSEKLEKFALEKLDLSAEKVEKFTKIKLSNGYATLGLSAVKKMLPYLRKGIKYSDAVYLANLPKVLGTNEITEELIKYFIDEIADITEKVKLQKQLNSVVNGLIKIHLDEDHRYFIENNRELDDSEKKSITTNLKLSFGENTWNEKLEKNKKENCINYVSKHYRNFLQKKITDKKDIFLEIPRLHDEIFKVLKDKYDIPEANIKYLWHPSEQEKYRNAEKHHKFTLNSKSVFISDSKIDNFKVKYPNAEDEITTLKLLGSPEPISKGFKNPMGLKTLYKLKHLLNHLLKTNQIDENTEIIIEIARELNDNNMRAAIKSYQTIREKENLGFKEKIEEINKVCGKTFNSEDEVLLKKIRLWYEQNQRCLYTGNQISLCDVLNGNKYDLEHTIPVSMSFDSELKNLTLCDTVFNREKKGKKIPYQLQDHDKILQHVSFMDDKIINLEKKIKDNVIAIKKVADKEIKDKMIQRRHLLKFDLKYWKAKYNTFTIQEYKLGWRNNQLRDTQTITKYALPYLKTIFAKVSAEKGITVSDFKKIFKVDLDEKKDRSKHSHHTIDAAILTLIPNSYHRDKILEEYNKAKETKTTYHITPLNWKKFKASTIISIENDVLANKLVDDRKLTETYKKVRKRGKIDYGVNKEPKIAKGDTIRGQLHKESFFGAIKQPSKENGKIVLDENNKMILEDEIKLVIRKNLKYKGTNDVDGFKNSEELEKVIVDKDLYEIIKKQVDGYSSFKEAMEKGVFMTDKEGNKINQIKKVRCFVKNKYDTAIKPHKHLIESKHAYKQTTYAENSENAYCLLYIRKNGNKIEKDIKVISLYDLSKLKLKNINEIYENPSYNTFTKKDKIFKLERILKAGDKFIFYKNSKAELLELTRSRLLDRLYIAYEFENDGRIKFKHHLIAGEMIKITKKYKNETNPEFIKYEPLLRISQKQWNFIIENKDFTIDIDGKIKWLFNS